jgi:hypothetical protein
MRTTVFDRDGNELADTNIIPDGGMVRVALPFQDSRTVKNDEGGNVYDAAAQARVCADARARWIDRLCAGNRHHVPVAIDAAEAEIDAELADLTDTEAAALQRLVVRDSYEAMKKRISERWKRTWTVKGKAVRKPPPFPMGIDSNPDAAGRLSALQDAALQARVAYVEQLSSRWRDRRRPAEV